MLKCLKLIHCFSILLLTTMPLVAETNKLPLELPPAIYAVPGIEMNIYFDNLVLTTNSSNYVFDVDCPKGRNDTKRWRFTPTDRDIGIYDWQLRVIDINNQVVATGNAKLYVVPGNTGAGRKIGLLLVGDSLTDLSIYPMELSTLLKQPGNPQVTFLGTNFACGKTPVEVGHEGYGGWTWGSFLTRWTEDAKYPYRAKSKFLIEKDGRRVLDFQAYCDKYLNGIKPDFITVMLGTNEMLCANENKLDASINDLFNNADILIAEFKRVAPQAEIGIALPPPPASCQDAFGSNYQCKMTRWQYRNNQFQLVKRMITKYCQNQQKGISLIPVFSNIDCENNFPKTIDTINSRNLQKAERLSNGVHPSKEGYQQIGDSFYCWLKYRLAGNKHE